VLSIWFRLVGFDWCAHAPRSPHDVQGLEKDKQGCAVHHTAGTRIPFLDGGQWSAKAVIAGYDNLIARCDDPLVLGYS
jgi:hypothetical protein